jgi:hypothetical protein
VVLQLPHSIDDTEDSENIQSQSSIEIYPMHIHDITKLTNTGQVVLQLTDSISVDNSENSESGESQSSTEMYSTSIKEIQDEMGIVGRDIQLTKAVVYYI